MSWAEQPLRVEAVLNRAEFMPYEPVVVWVSVHNTSSQVVKVVGAEGLDVSLGRIMAGEQNWEWSARSKPHSMRVAPAPPMPPREIVFQPGETREYGALSVRACFAYLGKEWRARLEQPGQPNSSALRRDIIPMTLRQRSGRGGG